MKAYALLEQLQKAPSLTGVVTVTHKGAGSSTYALAVRDKMLTVSTEPLLVGTLLQWINDLRGDYQTRTIAAFAWDSCFQIVGFNFATNALQLGDKIF
jgi:hypothetical protein